MLHDALAVHRGGDDASRIAGSLSAGEEALHRRMLERVRVAWNANGGRRAGLDRDDHGVIRVVSTHSLAEDPERGLEARTDFGREQLVDAHRREARRIARGG